MRGIPVLPLLVLLASPCPAATLCVRQSAPGLLSDGTSWASAYATVQSALSAASAGDEVWVAAGTYKENITLPSGVALYGGFSGTEASREQRDPRKNASILDGSGNGKSVVTIAKDATSQTILDGFTVQNGVVHSTSLEAHYGGGVYIAGGTPVLSNNIIQDCHAYGGKSVYAYGGGIFVASGTPFIVGNTIWWNHAIEGGGIYAADVLGGRQNPGGLIRDNLIAHNAAVPSLGTTGHGGGAVLGSGAVAVHNMILENQAMDSYGGGAGVVCLGGAVIDNTFQDNVGHFYAAIEAWENSTVVRNTITDFNTIQQPIYEVEFEDGTLSDNLIVTAMSACAIVFPAASSGNLYGTEPVIRNNTLIGVGSVSQVAVVSNYSHREKPSFSNNVVLGWPKAGYANPGDPARDPVFSVDHNDIYGNGDNTLALPGTSSNNISVDPLFVDPANGDYHLKAGSPCIDAGNDAYVKSQDRDLAGAPRIAGAHVDIGAYEVGSPLYTVQDAATVLRIAAGISLSTPADTSRLDVAGETGLTVTDATRIAQWLLN